MELSLLLMQSIFQLFLMVLLGFILVKSKVLKSSDSKVISLMLIYIVCPCAIIKSFQVEFTSDKLIGLGVAFLGAIIVHLIYIPLSEVLAKVFGFHNIEKATVVYSNSGNLIIPLVSAVLGEEWVLYASGYMVIQTILLWTHCNSMISGEKGFNLKKIITNVNVISIAVGIVLFFAHITLPSIIGGVVNSMGSMIGPLGMLVIGMLFADMNLTEIFKGKRTYLICALRLIIFPLIAIVVFKLLNLQALSPDAYKILLITTFAASAPAAAMVTQLAQLYDKHPGYASVLNVVSVIFSIFTMPLMAMIYQLL